MNKIPLSLPLSALLFTSLLHAQNERDNLTAPEMPDTHVMITTSHQRTELIDDTTSDVTVIRTGDIMARGDQTVSEAISRTAGISVMTNGGMGQPSSIFMRGEGAGSVLILLDGMRLNDPSTTDGRAMIENLTTDMIEQIEVLKGGASTVWGSNASAGVINIVTKKPEKGVHGSAALKAGSYDTYGGNARLSYGGEKLTAQLIASAIRSDSFSSLVPREAENDAYENSSLNLKAGYSFDSHNRIDLAYYLIDAEGDFDDYYSVAKAEDDYANYTSRQENIALNYRYSRNAFETVLRAAKGEYERDYFTDSYGKAQNHYEATIEELSLINTFTYAGGRAILGLEAKNIEGANTFASDGFSPFSSAAAYENRAVFLAHTYRFGGNTLLETNLRYDDYDAFENITTYKIGLKHDCSMLQGVTARANYYTAYDAPSSYQLANAAFGELLKPTYARGFDLSANYKDMISVTYFDKTREDAIDYDMVRYGYYNAAGDEKFSGLEVEGSYKLPQFSLVLGANYTHLFTYERYDETTLSNRAKETLNVSADYYLKGMHFGMTGSYVGDRVDVSTNDTGNYTVWNLDFDTSLAKNLTLYLNARNIFDKAYESVYGYATEGRSIYGKLTYRF